MSIKEIAVRIIMTSERMKKSEYLSMAAGLRIEEKRTKDKIPNMTIATNNVMNAMVRDIYSSK